MTWLYLQREMLRYRLLKFRRWFACLMGSHYPWKKAPDPVSGSREGWNCYCKYAWFATRTSKRAEFLSLFD